MGVTSFESYVQKDAVEVSVSVAADRDEERPVGHLTKTLAPKVSIEPANKYNSKATILLLSTLYITLEILLSIAPRVSLVIMLKW